MNRIAEGIPRESKFVTARRPVDDLFGWLNDQLLKMEWLYNAVRWLVESVFGLSMDGRVGGSLHFFIYDVIKIFILLSVLIFVISYIQSFFRRNGPEGSWGDTMGVGEYSRRLAGTITPFCSCSSIPLFIGFTSAGLPIGVTFHS